MNFFTPLSKIIKNFDLSLTIRNNDDSTLSISILPKNYSEKEGTVPSVVLTGTPEELDEVFLTKLRQPLVNAGLIVCSIKQFEDTLALINKSTKDKVKAAEKKATSTNTSSNKATTTTAKVSTPSLFPNA